MKTPEQYVAEAIGPDSGVGGRLARHVARPLCEDVEQAAACAVREALRAELEAVLARAEEMDDQGAIAGFIRGRMTP